MKILCKLALEMQRVLTSFPLVIEAKDMTIKEKRLFQKSASSTQIVEQVIQQ